MHDFIRVVDNVLDDQFCDRFVRAFDESPHLVQGSTSGGVDLDMKESHDLYLNDHAAHHPDLKHMLGHMNRELVRYVADHLFMLTGIFHLTVPHPETGEHVLLTQDNFETVGKPQLPALMDHCFRLGGLQAQRYRKGRGGYHYWHSEAQPQKGKNDALHRVLLFMAYLNDVAEGGETEFYYQDRKVAPRKGRMVIAPAYFTHTHRGNVPVSGDKYIVTSWLLFQPAQKIYG